MVVNLTKAYIKSFSKFLSALQMLCLLLSMIRKYLCVFRKKLYQFVNFPCLRKVRECVTILIRVC